MGEGKDIIQIRNHISIGPSPNKHEYVKGELDRFDVIICLCEIRGFYKPPGNKIAVHIPLIIAEGKNLPRERQNLILAARIIRDFYKARKNIYCHCWDGHTRCATAVALALVRDGKDIECRMKQLKEIGKGQIDFGGGSWGKLASDIKTIDSKF